MSTTDLNALTALLKKHPHDELIFGGYICTTCTPEDAYDPDQNVGWPCQQLLDVGMTEPVALGYLLGYQAAVEDIHRLKREEIGSLLAERYNLRTTADALAAHIGELTGAEIGEHSSTNNPWANALAAQPYDYDSISLPSQGKVVRTGRVVWDGPERIAWDAEAQT